MRKKNSPQYLCFRHAVLMDRMAYNKDGGIFGGFFSADWMRAISYKHAQVSTIPNQEKWVMGFLERHTDRKWVNLLQYLRNLNSRYNNV